MKTNEFLARVEKNFGKETMNRCKARIGETDEISMVTAQKVLGESLESQASHRADFVFGSRATLDVLDPDAFAEDPACPSEYQGYIYWRPGLELKPDAKTMLAYIHLLCQCEPTLENFRIMADKLRKTFPQAKDGEINARVILDEHPYSRYRSLICWGGELPLPQQIYPGYEVAETCGYNFA